jgi:type VI secretion system secreted protein Hcp
MAVDMFLYFEGGDIAVKGETQDKVYNAKSAIDVLAWSWGASQSGSTHGGGGSGAGKANFQDISLTKYVDKSSPLLLDAVARGVHFPKATLVVRKAGTAPLEYMIIQMDDILISSLQMGGSGGEDKLTENVTLNFGSFEYKYTEQLKDGKPGEKPMVKFDIAANAPK